MGKHHRRPRVNAAQQIDRMARQGGPMDYPKSIPEAIERGDRMVQAVTIRNARQKAFLDRASELMTVAIDQCTCGGVARALSQVQKGDGREEATAPDQEDH